MTAFEIQCSEPEKTTTTNGAASILIADETSKLQTSVQPDEASGIQEDEWTYPWPTDFKLGEHYIDDVQSLKVCIIGAGLAGITAGALLPVKVPGMLQNVNQKEDMR